MGPDRMISCPVGRFPVNSRAEDPDSRRRIGGSAEPNTLDDKLNALKKRIDSQ
jgi:hypothetical protein